MSHQHTTEARKKRETHNPVCGKRVNRNKAHITIEYQGETYLLCCPLSQAEFERDPERSLS